MNLPNDLSAVHLTGDRGRKGHCGCWMVTLNVYLGQTDWSDDCHVVDPLIRQICITINDTFGDGASRTKAITEFGLLRPLQSRYAGVMSHNYWLYVVFDFVVRQQLPLVLEFVQQQNVVSHPMADNATQLRQLETITDRNTLEIAIAKLQTLPMPPTMELTHLVYCLNSVGARSRFELVGEVLDRLTTICDQALGVCGRSGDDELYYTWTAHAMLKLLDNMLQMIERPVDIPAVPVGGYSNFYETLGTRPDDGN